MAGQALSLRSVDPLVEPEHCEQSGWERLWQRWGPWRRRQRIKRFAAACVSMDEAVGLRDGDQVFLPTTSLFDLLGLVRYLQTRVVPTAVVWHVCFHYGFLQGREPQYAEQSAREEQIRRQLLYLVQHVPGNQLRFYATTDKLAHQFNRLGIAHFEILPFPVDHGALQQQHPTGVSHPLRLTCAGFLRREKGKMWASGLVQGLWDTELVPGHVQLVVQTNQRQARRMLPRGEPTRPRFRADLRGVGCDPIVWLRHPLTRDAYLDLIRNSDIALFLHDGAAYYTRCSGVLVEMLAAGVPVLVPAGSWLAEQVAEPMCEHLEGLASQGTCLVEGSPREIGWQYPVGQRCTAQPQAELVVGGDDLEAFCDVSVPITASALLTSLQWQHERGTGQYLRISADQLGTALPPTTSILSPCPPHDCVWALIHLAPGTTRVRLRLRNAFDDSPIAIRTTKIYHLAHPAEGPGSYPAGSVGLIFADIEQLPILVRNMREHYVHYRRTALQFAQQWRHRHDAQQIVAALLRDSSILKAVA